jgi:hypothetical protein
VTTGAAGQPVLHFDASSEAACDTCRVEAAQVSLLRWLRRQLRQPIPMREHLEAAVENDDVAEARRLLAGFEFSDEQRRNVEQLLDAWERQHAR